MKNVHNFLRPHEAPINLRDAMNLECSDSWYREVDEWRTYFNAFKNTDLPDDVRNALMNPFA